MRYPRDRSPNEREVLVVGAAFLCAAWPTLESQNQ
jgi:hypothetical protein